MADGLKPGDRVSFKFEGAPDNVCGHGIVTRMVKGQPTIQPDQPIGGGARLRDILKVEAK